MWKKNLQHEYTVASVCWYIYKLIYVLYNFIQSGLVEKKMRLIFFIEENLRTINLKSRLKWKKQ